MYSEYMYLSMLCNKTECCVFTSMIMEYPSQMWFCLDDGDGRRQEIYPLAYDTVEF